MPNLKESLHALAETHRPCVAIAVTLSPTIATDGDCEAGLESTLDAMPASDLATALAAMKYAHVLACQRLADAMGVPLNTLMNQINEEYNSMQARDLDI